MSKTHALLVFLVGAGETFWTLASFSASDASEEVATGKGELHALGALSKMLMHFNPASSFVPVVGPGRSCSNDGYSVRCTPASRSRSGSPRMPQVVYDVAIVGGGPVGLNAALKAASLGKKPVIIDATPGTQVQFTGPTGFFSKALREAAQRIDVKVLRNMGIGDRAIWAQVNEVIQSLMKKSGKNNADALSRLGIPALRGSAKLVGKQGDLCETKVTWSNPKTPGAGFNVLSRKVLLATGSRAVKLRSLPEEMYQKKPGQPLHVFDSDSIKGLSFLPRSVAIVGGGIIAVEFARIFSALAAKVTMIIRSKDLPASLARVGIDRELGIELENDLKAAGVRLLFETEVESAEDVPCEQAARRRGTDGGARSVRMVLKRKGQANTMPLASDILLTATGRNACSAGLGLCELGGDDAISPNGDVVTCGDLMTMVPDVYAAGDLIGAPQLASTGISQAESAVQAMFTEASEEKESVDREGTGSSPQALLSDSARFPIGIWTIPEVSFVGLSAEAARKQGVEVIEGTARYLQSIRGHVHGISASADQKKGGEMTLKMVVERAAPHAVIGVHIFGDDACELIHYGTTLVQGRKTLTDVLALIYTAVTYHELYRLAAFNALDTIAGQKWTRLYEAAVGEDTERVTADTAKHRLVAAGANEDDAERVASLFEKRKYKTVDDFIRFAGRFQDPDGVLPEERFACVESVKAYEALM